MTLHDIISRDLENRKPCHALSQKFYADRDVFNLDLDLIFYKEWIFAGHECEIPKPGDYFTMQLGAFALIVVRDQAGELRVHHNTCRHRGFKICAATHGHVKHRFVCPYHQWSYELDGALARARETVRSKSARTQIGARREHRWHRLRVRCQRATKHCCPEDEVRTLPRAL